MDLNEREMVPILICVRSKIAQLKSKLKHLTSQSHLTHFHSDEENDGFISELVSEICFSWPQWSVVILPCPTLVTLVLVERINEG